MARGLVLAVLFAGVLLGALDIAIVGPALPAIQAAFDVDGGSLSWTFTVYILFYIAGAPLLAKLSDLRGRRLVFAGCVGVFGVGSLLVAAAPTFEALLAGRAVQAFGAAGIFPVASAVIAETFPVQRRGRALGLLGAAFGIAFVIGPLLGGVLLRFGWEWLFLVNVPVVGLVLWMSLRVLPDGPARASAPFDATGAVVLTVVLAALTLGISGIDVAAPLAGVAGSSVWPFLAVSAMAAGLLWRVERRAAEPILPPALLRSRQLRVAACIAVAVGVVEAAMVFLPAMSVHAFGVTPSAASFMLVPLVLTLAIGAPAAGRLLDAIGPKPVIQVGLMLTVTGLVAFAALPTTRPSFYAAGICVGLGLSALLGAPLRYVVLEASGEQRRGAGQGLLTLCLSIGQLLGATLIGAVVASGASELTGYRDAWLYLAALCAVAVMISVSLEGRGAVRHSV